MDKLTEALERIENTNTSDKTMTVETDDLMLVVRELRQRLADEAQDCEFGCGS